jgi:hypothetical protein
MRYVSFPRLVDLLRVVAENNGLLGAAALERLATERQVLISNIGAALSHSTGYHYGKILEHLGLVTLVGGKYFVSEPLACSLLSPHAAPGQLTELQRETLAEIVANDADCQEFFFDYLTGAGSHGLMALRSSKESASLVIQTASRSRTKASSTTPVLVQSSNGTQRRLASADEVNAVYWGVRRWSLDLEMADEIVEGSGKSRTIYPCNPSVEYRTFLDTVLAMSSEQLQGDWATLHIPTLLRRLALATHCSMKRASAMAIEMAKRNPRNIVFVKTSQPIAELRTSFRFQDHAIQDLYLHDASGTLISHIKVRNPERGGQIWN